MTPTTPASPSPAAGRAEQINRAIAEKVNGWTYHPEVSLGGTRRRGYYTTHDAYDILEECFSPMTDAAQAFVLVKRLADQMELTIARDRGGCWMRADDYAGSGAVYEARSDTFEQCACLLTLRVAGIDPESL